MLCWNVASSMILCMWGCMQPESIYKRCHTVVNLPLCDERGLRPVRCNAMKRPDRSRLNVLASMGNNANNCSHACSVQAGLHKSSRLNHCKLHELQHLLAACNLISWKLT